MFKFIDDFIEDPVGETLDRVTQPFDDAIDVVDGLTELELRESAALRLGSEVASGMLLSELIEWYNTST
jgi:hypothetical protein